MSVRTSSCSSAADSPPFAKIERGGYNVWQSRPSLAKWEKAALVAGALLRRVGVDG